jgi:hypothetical protein
MGRTVLTRELILDKVKEYPWQFDQCVRSMNLNKDKLITIPNSLLIDTYIPDNKYTEENLQNLQCIASYILENFINKGFDSIVVLCEFSEGFVPVTLDGYDKIIKLLSSKHGIPISQFRYVCNAAKTTENLKLYHQHCADFNWIPIEIYSTDPFENPTSFLRSLTEPIQEHSKDPKRFKKFLFLNKGLRPHRIALTSELLKRNLIKDCYFSFCHNVNSIDIESLIINSLSLFFSDKILDFAKTNTVDFLKDPIWLTLQDNGSNMHCPSEEDIKIHQYSLFSVVSETLFFSNADYKSDSVRHILHALPGYTFTEKTYRCIWLKHPFVLSSYAHSLRNFREQGYKTFHPHINESYDCEENDENRIIMIADEIQRLCNMSEQETTTWLHAVHDVCDYNYKILISRCSTHDMTFRKF